uniref:Uncharacterized protein n=1 Tax=Rhizochromulina marina TaxID=1034831 RepID=A0A7S2RMC9_9STRA|mmetsp:Transcript_18233/g.53284  ORF Transcript_18233/g.53284 Transcript_18233/m.53284 type:complete len:195 (+) Transcript_18233:2-586(+)
MMTFSLMFYLLSFAILSAKFKNDDDYRETVLYLQISLAIETLIFNCREPNDWFWASVPDLRLTLSVLFANALVVVFAFGGIIVAKLQWYDVLIVLLYDTLLLFVVDALKVGYQRFMTWSGLTAYFDSLGQSARIEKGSFLGNRCAELLRFIFCLKQDQEFMSLFDTISPMRSKAKETSEDDEPGESARLLGGVV